MEMDSILPSLLQSLTLPPPYIPPKTWDSIPSESGSGAAPHSAAAPVPSLSTIPESLLVRLVLNALHGVKPALLEIAALSAAPADRSAATLRNRSSSTAALASTLRSVARAGSLVFLHRSFVSHYRFHPPSLVNQAFAVAVGKVLEGYYSGLGTLSASVRARRGEGGGGGSVTVLEVCLHSKELRTKIEALANVCLREVACGELSVDCELEFERFPRGVDLLSYLYVRLRDADPVNCALLKFLFVRSCEPYCAFIKSWIYQASSEDPYEEFFNVHSDNSLTTRHAIDFSFANMKEKECISVPCFLKDFGRPLFRAGQQLQVLVRLLNLCNSAVNEPNVSCNLENLVDILPLWPGMSSDSVLLWNPISFGRKDVEAMTLKRKIMYESLAEKLHSFFTKLNTGNQLMNQNVTTYGTLRNMAGKRKGANVPFPLIFDEDLNMFSSGNELGTTVLDAVQQDDASSNSNESLYDIEPSKYSDCSSVNSSAEEIEPRGISVPHATRHTNESVLQLFSGANSLFSHQYPCCSSGESPGPVSSIPDLYHENVDLNEISLHQSGNAECVQVSKIIDVSLQSNKFWPLGGLLTNPFCTDIQDNDPKDVNLTGCSLCMTHGDTKAMKGEESYFGETSLPLSFELDPVRRIQIMNGIHKSLSSSNHQPSDFHDYYDLSMNPMLTKPAWLRTVRNSRDRSSINIDGSFFPNFDFSSIVDPSKACSENIVDVPYNGSQVLIPVPLDGVSAVKVHEFSCARVQDNMDNPQPVSSSDCSSRKPKTLLGEISSSGSGGENWDGLVTCYGDVSTLTREDTCHDFGAMFEIPLDIIIDKCIAQEILLQYKYVSNFTIKLLEEGFDLRDHLLALRRYHFMELADWADTFIISLCNKSWLTIAPEQKIAEVQGLLDLAIQRSSCENDHYKERLFVLMKEDSMMHHSISLTGVHAFDFVMLGYKVDWPVSIIVSQDALTTYAEIFTFLIQVRLGAFSLSDAWRSLKAIKHLMRHSQQKSCSKMNDLNTLIRIRQQINHFVSTLQQFVHSQLSDVSWCRFQHALKHQVKDILDLESIHARYLSDALHICFLSAETKSVATLVSNILQCALDFRLCLKGNRFDYGPDDVEASNLRSRINFSQVFAVKANFEKNLKDLYLLYLKSPKHGEFSISRFWSYLNHNNYYSTTISKDIDYYYES